MAIQMSDGFKLRAEKYLDDRENFKTKLEMKNFDLSEMPDGFITYCEEDLKHYKLIKAGTENLYTGMWTPLSVGATGDGEAVNEETVISQAVAQSKNYTNAEIEKIIDNAPSNLNTLNELANATISNKNIINAINNSLINKANKSDIYKEDGITPKYITSEQIPDYVDQITWEEPTTDSVGNINIGFIPPEEGMAIIDFLHKMTHRPIEAKIEVLLTPRSSFGAEERGTEIANPIITATIVKGTSTPIEIKFYRDNEVINTKPYIESNLQYNHQDNYVVTENTIYKAEVKYLLNGTSNTASSSTEYVFIPPSYIGTLLTPIPSEADIKSLTKKVLINKVASYEYSQISSWMCFAYPSSFGDLFSIKDTAPGYQLIGGWGKQIMTINNQLYNVYTSSQCTVNNYEVEFS